MNNECESEALWFGDQRIAILSQIFQHQGTWFADYRLAPNVGGRVLEFINFSRVHLSSGEFDEETLRSFEDIDKSMRWIIRGPGGVIEISSAPLFRDTDLSWVTE